MTTQTAPLDSRTAAPLALQGGPALAAGLQIPAWPPVNDKVADRLAEVYRSRAWSFNGPNEREFCKKFAEAHDAKFGIFMANGTVTLQASLLALGVGPGDEVIVPAYTWIATAMSVRYVGATPVLVDIEPTTLCMDPAAFERAITPKTKAVIPVHLYGGAADLDAIIAIARKNKIAVIEDCAHAHGGKWAGKGLGSVGDVGSFSFQQSKTMACGEGGICITNDADLAFRLYQVKHIGYSDGASQGKATQGPAQGLQCHNFRGTEFAAVILLDQVESLASLIATYNKNADRLTQMVDSIPGVRVQSRGRRAAPQSYYTWTILFDQGPLSEVPMGVIAEAFAAEGMGGYLGYGAVDRHMLFNLKPGEYRLGPGGCPVSHTGAATRLFAVNHTFLSASPADIERIGLTIAKVASHVDDLKAYAASKK